MSVSCSVMSNSLRPHQLQPSRLLTPCNSPGKNTGVGSHSLLQGVFPTQGQKLDLLHCRQILYHQSQLGFPFLHPARKMGSLCLCIFSLYKNHSFSFQASWGHMPSPRPIRDCFVLTQNKFQASLVVQMAKNPPSMQEIWVQSLGQEDPLVKEMAIDSSILAWRISWTEEPGGLKSMGLQRVRHN